MRYGRRLLPVLMLPILAVILAACQPASDLATQAEEQIPVVDEVTQPDTLNPVVRSSTLIGYEIETPDSDYVAEIDEVLIDSSGAIRFIIYEAGGFADFDKEYVALDWDLFEFDPGADTVTYIGTADDLAGAPPIDMTILDEPALLVDAAQLALPEEMDGLIRVSQFERFDLLDANFVNTGGEDLGEMEELLIDLTEGQTLYGIADVGGFLGMAGERTVAIPWTVMQYNETENQFAIPADAQTLEQAPTIALPAFDETDFTTDWDSQFQTYWDKAI